ncbi:MAG: hypothetical protein FWE18_00020 [Alphaproteobacteria bacterium]|nr:hypothetical protein [Alphaproteobacteria bacterium]
MLLPNPNMETKLSTSRLLIILTNLLVLAVGFAPTPLATKGYALLLKLLPA